MAFSRLLIANRGEIAVRIQRAARELNMTTIQVYSAADADSLAVKMADEAINIGPPHAAKSYLNISAILEAAEASGAEAIHPGYGFLSESPAFADAVEAAGLVFVGPTGSTIRAMGDKSVARLAAEKAGVPVVPGSEGRLVDFGRARIVATEIGYPVMIKASAGGGGRGIRIVESAEGLEAALDQAGTEAKAAFGDSGLYLEKFIARARHIEVQVLGDGRDVIHCYERECSLQRRRQKVWEEAPSLALKPDVREALCACAVELAKSVAYRGAGTLEFLYDDETERFYFIEMNTRIQVEHPVTEMVIGIDLVREMLRIAAGGSLTCGQSDIRVRGHSLEARINAEEPARNFHPSPGTVTRYRAPGGAGTRFDTLLYEGCQVTPFYDSLVGKLIVWDETREAALARMRRALTELVVDGIATTAPLHQELVEDDAVRKGAFHTRWLEDWLSSRRPRTVP
jgi:acetyl-CoA carboxylase, biotin carboxylase subunit